jgi:bifunctional non-homologous end joining protein LigD
MEWEVRKRSGKIFVDHNMNRVGANIAAVYSVRPEPGATVSMPVTWEEVETADIRPGDFTIRTAWDRLAQIGSPDQDPFRALLNDPQDITKALDALGVASKTEGSAPTPPRETSEEVIARSKDPKLGQYLSMRTFGDAGTPEPAGGGPSPGGNSFVIQKHDATRLHYDVRLEREGVLVSWAVPKGLPLVKGERHLAVHTEDHPLEYGSFEGPIPKGHYGAGEVRIWDAGTYDLLEWTDKKVSFRLHGSRYDGQEYHLVKTARAPNDWLVFMAGASPEIPPAKPPTFTPMLAELWPAAFDADGWVFEPKLDGIRALVYVGDNATRLVSRRGNDRTASYPELARLHERITAVNAVVDGEIVAQDPSGRPSFGLLQQRMNLASDSDIARIRRQIPVQIFVFDLLWLDGQDLTSKPLSERRARLEEIVVPGKGLNLVYGDERTGTDFFEAAKAIGLEGIVAKRLASRYTPGKRSNDWRKVKILNRQDCVVLGWTPGKGGRGTSFGALLLGAYVDGSMRWIGQVGSGFTDRMLDDLMRRLKDLQTDGPPIDDPELRAVKGARWVRPEMVCSVEYLEVTQGGRKLRAPSYKGLRDDIPPEDCVLEVPAAG